MKTYIVTVTNIDSWETPGSLEITAKSANDAIKQARREMAKSGHMKGDGRLQYSARLDA